MIESENHMDQSDFAPSEPVHIEVIKPRPFESGFGYGEGAISYASRARVVGPDTVAAVESAIDSSEILIPISRDGRGQYIEDDGCGDGRNVRRVFMGRSQKSKSLVRPKVFGGGATMLAAIEIGTGELSEADLNPLFKRSIAVMRRHRIDFGAHTDTHATEENSGCGAIDRAPQVIANIPVFEAQIRGTLEEMGVDLAGIDDVIANYKTCARKIEGAPYSGKEVIEDVIREGKIVKELEDNHYEMFVLLNMSEGFTVNQDLVRQVSDGKVQVFGVDVWRLQSLAMKRFPGDTALQNQAFLSELVYTLGVSATLT